MPFEKIQDHNESSLDLFSFAELTSGTNIKAKVIATGLDEEGVATSIEIETGTVEVTSEQQPPLIPYLTSLNIIPDSLTPRPVGDSITGEVTVENYDSNGPWEIEWDWTHAQSSEGELPDVPFYAPTDEEFADAAKVFQERGLDPSSQPIRIFRPQDANDVKTLLQWCVNNNNEFVVRCGGHSYILESTGNNINIIDVRDMNAVTLDATTNLADVGAGAYLWQVDRAINCDESSNRQIQLGTCPHVGISGVISAGGLNPLQRQYGLICDTIEEITMVVADDGTGSGPKIITANATNEYSDIFEGIKGVGNSSLGIVTNWKLHTSERQITHTRTLQWDIDDFSNSSDSDWVKSKNAFNAWQTTLSGLPDNIDSICSVMKRTNDLHRMHIAFTSMDSIDVVNDFVDTTFLPAVGITPDSDSTSDNEGNTSSFSCSNGYEDYATTWQLSKSAIPSVPVPIVEDSTDPEYTTDVIYKVLDFYRTMGPTLTHGRLLCDALGGPIIEDGTGLIPWRSGMYTTQFYCGNPDDGIRQDVIDNMRTAYNSYKSDFDLGGYVGYVDSDIENPLEFYYGDNLPTFESLKSKYDPNDVFPYGPNYVYEDPTDDDPPEPPSPVGAQEDLWDAGTTSWKTYEGSIQSLVGEIGNTVKDYKFTFPRNLSDETSNTTCHFPMGYFESDSVGTLDNLTFENCIFDGSYSPIQNTDAWTALSGQLAGWYEADISGLENYNERHELCGQLPETMLDGIIPFFIQPNVDGIKIITTKPFYGVDMFVDGKWIYDRNGARRDYVDGWIASGWDSDTNHPDYVGQEQLYYYQGTGSLCGDGSYDDRQFIGDDDDGDGVPDDPNPNWKKGSTLTPNWSLWGNLMGFNEETGEHEAVTSDPDCRPGGHDGNPGGPGGLTGENFAGDIDFKPCPGRCQCPIRRYVGEYDWPNSNAGTHSIDYDYLQITEPHSDAILKSFNFRHDNDGLNVLTREDLLGRHMIGHNHNATDTVSGRIDHIENSGHTDSNGAVCYTYYIRGEWKHQAQRSFTFYPLMSLGQDRDPIHGESFFAMKLGLEDYPNTDFTNDYWRKKAVSGKVYVKVNEPGEAEDYLRKVNVQAGSVGLSFRRSHDIENFDVKNCTFRNFRTDKQPIHSWTSGTPTDTNRHEWVNGKIEKSKFSFNSAGMAIGGNGVIFDRNLVEYVGKGRGIITGSGSKKIQITNNVISVTERTGVYQNGIGWHPLRNTTWESDWEDGPLWEKNVIRYACGIHANAAAFYQYAAHGKFIGNIIYASKYGIATEASEAGGANGMLFAHNIILYTENIFPGPTNQGLGNVKPFDIRTADLRKNQGGLYADAVQEDGSVGYVWDISDGVFQHYVYNNSCIHYGGGPEGEDHEYTSHPDGWTTNTDFVSDPQAIYANLEGSWYLNNICAGMGEKSSDPDNPLLRVDYNIVLNDNNGLPIVVDGETVPGNCNLQDDHEERFTTGTWNYNGVTDMTAFFADLDGGDYTPQRYKQCGFAGLKAVGASWSDYPTKTIHPSDLVPGDLAHVEYWNGWESRDEIRNNSDVRLITPNVTNDCYGLITTEHVLFGRGKNYSATYETGGRAIRSSKDGNNTLVYHNDSDQEQSEYFADGTYSVCSNTDDAGCWISTTTVMSEGIGATSWYMDLSTAGDDPSGYRNFRLYVYLPDGNDNRNMRDEARDELNALEPKDRIFTISTAQGEITQFYWGDIDGVFETAGSGSGIWLGDGSGNAHGTDDIFKITGFEEDGTPIWDVNQTFGDWWIPNVHNVGGGGGYDYQFGIGRIST